MPISINQLATSKQPAEAPPVAAPPPEPTSKKVGMSLSEIPSIAPTPTLFDKISSKVSSIAKPAIEAVEETAGEASSAFKSLYTKAAVNTAEAAKAESSSTASMIKGEPMPGLSIMDKFGLPPEPAAPAPGAPYDPSYKRAVEAAWYSASPVDRAAMATQPGLFGETADRLNQQFDKVDAQTSEQKNGKVPGMISLDSLVNLTAGADKRVESRVKNLESKGINSELAKTVAAFGAKFDIPPGQEADVYFGGHFGTASPLKGDPGLRAEYDKQSSIRRGINYGSLYTYKGGFGLLEAVTDISHMDSLSGIHDWAAGQAGKAQTAMQSIEGSATSHSYAERQLEGVVNSMTMMAPYMLASGGATVPQRALWLLTFGNEYHDGKQAGLTLPENTFRASTMAMLEVWGEKYSMPGKIKLIKSMVRGAPFKEMQTLIPHIIKRELAGEYFTGFSELGFDKWAPAGMALNPNATMADAFEMARDITTQVFMQGLIMHGAGRMASTVRQTYENATRSKLDIPALVASAVRAEAIEKWTKNGLIQPKAAVDAMKAAREKARTAEEAGKKEADITVQGLIADPTVVPAAGTLPVTADVNPPVVEPPPPGTAEPPPSITPPTPAPTAEPVITAAPGTAAAPPATVTPATPAPDPVVTPPVGGPPVSTPTTATPPPGSPTNNLFPGMQQTPRAVPAAPEPVDTTPTPLTPAVTPEQATKLNSRFFLLLDIAVIKKEISARDADLLRWFASQGAVFHKAFDSVDLSVRSPNPDALGSYNYGKRLIKLFSDPNHDMGMTLVHEALHHLERFMPLERQREITAMWAKALRDKIATSSGELKNHLEAVHDYELAVAQNQPKAVTSLLYRVVESTGSKASKEVHKAHGKSGKFDKVLYDEEIYQYRNSSEFWAVNGSRIMSDKYKQHLNGESKSQLRQWFEDFVDKLKTLLHIDKDTAMMKAIRDIMEGNGQEQTTDMLSGAVQKAIMGDTPQLTYEQAVAALGQAAQDINVAASEVPPAASSVAQSEKDPGEMNNTVVTLITKPVRDFHKVLSNQVKTTAAKMQQQAEAYHKSGKLPFAIGTRFTTKSSREMGKGPWTVIEHYVSSTDPERYGYIVARELDNEGDIENGTMLVSDPKADLRNKKWRPDFNRAEEVAGWQPYGKLSAVKPVLRTSIEESRSELESLSAKVPKAAPARPKRVTIDTTGNKIDDAFRALGLIANRSPSMRQQTAKMEVYLKHILSMVNAGALGKKAHLAEAILAGAMSKAAQQDSSYYHKSYHRGLFWEGKPSLARRFINGFEKGDNFENDPQLALAATAYRQWLADIYQNDTRAGIKYDPVDNYLPHLFVNSKEVSEWFEKKYGKNWGKPGFTKDRAFDFYEEAIKNNFIPRFTNPEDILLARQHASVVAQMKIDIINQLEAAGLAFNIRNNETGKKIAPPGTNFSKTQSAPNGNTYWVHNEAYIMLQKAFDNQSYWTEATARGALFRSAMKLKNAIVPIQLAFSLFHPLHVATIHAATAMQRASIKLFAGESNPVKWAYEMTKGLLFVDLIKQTGQQLNAARPEGIAKGGHRVLQIWKGMIPENEVTQADILAIQTLFEGGLIPEMSSQDRKKATENFQKAWAQVRGEQGPLSTSGVKAVWHLPWALMETLQRPIFEVWIPSLKISSYLKDAQLAMQLDPSLQTDMLKRIERFTRLRKSADNRYGEMAYNTLFWNRHLRDLGVLATLSMGWQLGFVREYGGAFGDIGHTLKMLANYKTKTTMRGPGNTRFNEESQMWVPEHKAAIDYYLATRDRPLNLTEKRISELRKGSFDRPIYALYYIGMGLMYSGLMSLWMSGEPPEGLDYILPRTGRTLTNGEPERVNTMFYNREFLAFAKHLEADGVMGGLAQLAINKASGVIGMEEMWRTGRDTMGREIRDPNAPIWSQMWQTIGQTFIEITPISVDAIKQGESPGLALAGFSRAPAYMTDTPIEGQIKHLFKEYNVNKITPFERANMSEERRNLKELYLGDDQVAYEAAKSGFEDKYQLTGKDTAKMEKDFEKDISPFLRMFAALPWQRQKILLDKMSPEERETYVEVSNKTHLRYNYEPPSEESE